LRHRDIETVWYVAALTRNRPGGRQRACCRPGKTFAEQPWQNGENARVEGRRTVARREIIIIDAGLQSGYFHSIDEIIVLEIRARHQKEQPQRSETVQREQAYFEMRAHAEA